MMLDAKSLANRLGVSVKIARRLMSSGEIETVNVVSNPGSTQKRLRVTPEALDRFISRRSSKPTTKAPARPSAAEGVTEFF